MRLVVRDGGRGGHRRSRTAGTSSAPPDSVGVPARRRRRPRRDRPHARAIPDRPRRGASRSPAPLPLRASTSSSPRSSSASSPACTRGVTRGAGRSAAKLTANKHIDRDAAPRRSSCAGRWIDPVGADPRRGHHRLGPIALREAESMSKLIYSMIASLDGYVADESGSFDWAEPDASVHSFINDLERSVGTYLCGRRMYEVMSWWETVGDSSDAAASHRRTSRGCGARLTRSSTPRRSSTSPRRGRGSSATSIAAPSRDEGWSRSATSRSAVRRLPRRPSPPGLVDEYQLFISPVIVGGGLRAFLGRRGSGPGASRRASVRQRVRVPELRAAALTRAIQQALRAVAGAA